MTTKTPFNKPYLTKKEQHYIMQVLSRGQLAGDGPFTKYCSEWLERTTGSAKALLTHSCTAALEMMALLLNIEPGDEIIMPSYTFVSTANAFVLRGGVPVFVDIREDTLNLDERLIEAAITKRTRAIVPVHYAGVACEMDSILEIAKRYSLHVVEDAAQGVMATYKGKALGSLGCLGAYSFHETKNIISGEGGALLINNEQLIQRAEIIREKGTDRSSFFRNEIDKYTWQEVGSSFLPSEISASILFAQLEEAKKITKQRLIIWENYHSLLEILEKQGLLRRQFVPSHCGHNAHMYYIVLAAHINRQLVLEALKNENVFSTFHYVPLHSSPGGKRYCRAQGDLDVTTRQSEQLIRLPLWVGLTKLEQERVVELLSDAIVYNSKRG